MFKNHEKLDLMMTFGDHFSIFAGLTLRYGPAKGSGLRFANFKMTGRSSIVILSLMINILWFLKILIENLRVIQDY